MAIEYTWKINHCEYDIATGGITSALCHVEAVDGDFTTSAQGTCYFCPDHLDPGFTPYEQVTEADVLSWCWACDMDKARIEAALAAKIELQKNPVVAKGTPW